MTKSKKAITIEIDEKDKKSLRMLLKHQKAICRKKEDRRRGEYMR